jgi:hypothetical protein
VIKKVIFLLESPFSKRDFERYGIEILKTHGFLIEIWDLSPFLNPEFYNNYIQTDLLKTTYCKLLKSKTEINNLLLKLKRSDIIMSLIPVNKRSIFIFYFLSLNKINFGFSFVNTIPVSLNPLSLRNRFFNLITNPKLLIDRILNLVSFNKSFKLYPNYIIVGGKRSLDLVEKKNLITEKTTIIKTHTRDYDIFLKNKNIKSSFYENFIVFLDEFAPYHPDSLFFANEPDCYPETYYPDINRFFSNIEMKTKLKVVISAHPRSNYNKIGNPYDGRKIIYNETPNLVKNSKLVLVHASTSVNFAILFKKPLISINSSKYSKSYQHSINVLSNELSINSYDISKKSKTNFLKDFDFNQKTYNNYKELYIKTRDSENLNQWDIFSNYIKTFQHE